MNPKALLFDKFLKTKKLHPLNVRFLRMRTVLSYTVLTLNPRCGICLYLSFLITVFYSVIRLVLGPEKVTAQKYECLECVGSTATMRHTKKL